MPLTDVQWVLRHAHLSTTQLYLTPVPSEVIATVLAHHRRASGAREHLETAMVSQRSRSPGQRGLVAAGPVAPAVRQPARPGESVAVTSNYRVCLLLLVSADSIRPTVDWLLTPRAPHSLAPDLARTRDPDGFAELAALCDASPAGRSMNMAVMRSAATIVAVKGGTVRDITVCDCLEMGLILDRDRNTRPTQRDGELLPAATPDGCLRNGSADHTARVRHPGQAQPEQVLAP
jgi:hypothetical protein